MALAILRGRADNDPLILDLTLEATHSRQAEIASSPVETGASVADHRRSEPIGYSFRGLFTTEDPSEQRGEQRLSEGRDPLARARNAITPDPLRAEKLLADLITMQEEGTLLVLFTETEVLDDMVLLSLDHRRRTSGREIEVSGTFKKLRTATSVVLEVAPIPELRQGERTKNQGKQATKPADEGTKGRSVLKRIL